ANDGSSARWRFGRTSSPATSGSSGWPGHDNRKQAAHPRAGQEPGRAGGRMTRTLPGGPNATLAILSAAVTSYTIGQSLLGPVLPTLQAELHTSATNATWVLTSYLLSSAVWTPIFGRFADAY